MPSTYLNVPFRDKDNAKALGARWDPAQRQWYVPDGRELSPFAAWLPAGHEPDSRAVAPIQPVAPALLAAEAVPAYGLPARQPGISLSQLLAGVAQAVAQACPAAVWTLVEVVDARVRNGHVYLELSERDAQGQVLAKANAMVWASTAERILPEFERATGATLAAGLKLLVRARPVFKPQYGFSLEIDAIDSGYTLGDLEARKREIRERLQREGLYPRQQQLAPPWDYQQVLVVAPEGGAGLGDFQAEAARLERFGLCRFRYVHSRFQGEGAAGEIRAALQAALAGARAPDAVAIIRGGGAVNDLAWLDDYALARAVCELDLPVLTGIGHERDRTLLDEVAQQRFDTPSKVIAGIEQLIVRRAVEAKANFEAVARLSQRAIALGRGQLQQTEAQVRSLARRQLDTARHQVPSAWEQIQAGARTALRAARSQSRLRLQQVTERAADASRRAREESARALREVADLGRQTLRQAQQDSQALMREIAGQGPEKTLARGFALVRDEAGHPLQRAAEVRPGQTLQIQFHDGQVGARAEPSAR